MSIVVSYEARTVAAVVNPVIAASMGAKNRSEVKSEIVKAQPAIGYTDAVAELFSIAFQRCRPATVAVMEGSGAALDLSLAAWDDTDKAYKSRCSMQLRCADLTGEVVAFEPVKMVYAALVLEQSTEVSRCLDNLASLVDADGFLSVVVESAGQVKVSRGQDPSLTAQTSFISPIWLMDALAKRGFNLVQDRRRSVSPGKGYWMGVFHRAA